MLATTTQRRLRVPSEPEIPAIPETAEEPLVGQMKNLDIANRPMPNSTVRRSVPSNPYTNDQSIRRATLARRRSSGVKQPLGVNLSFGNSPSTVRQFRRVSDQQENTPVYVDEGSVRRTFFSESNTKEAVLGRKVYARSVGLTCQEELTNTSDQEKREALSRLAEAWSDLETIDPEGLLHVVKGMVEKIQEYVFQHAPFDVNMLTLPATPNSPPLCANFSPRPLHNHSRSLSPTLLRSPALCSRRATPISRATSVGSQRPWPCRPKRGRSHLRIRTCKVYQGSMFLVWSIRSSWRMCCMSGGQQGCGVDGRDFSWCKSRPPYLCEHDTYSYRLTLSLLYFFGDICVCVFIMMAHYICIGLQTGNFGVWYRDCWTLRTESGVRCWTADSVVPFLSPDRQGDECYHYCYFFFF